MTCWTVGLTTAGGFGDTFHLKRWGVLVAQPRRIVRWRGAVNAITVGRKTPSFPGYWFRVKGLRMTEASESANNTDIPLFTGLQFHRGYPVSLHPAMHAICHRFRLLSTHTPVFWLCHGYHGYYRRRSEWVLHADLWKVELRQVAENFWEWHMMRTQDPLRSIVGAKELPGLCSQLFSLHLLATPLSLPGSFGPKPCAPLVGPFSSGTLLGPGVTEGFNKGGISPSLLPG